MVDTSFPFNLKALLRDFWGKEVADPGPADRKGIQEKLGIFPVSKLQFEPNVNNPSSLLQNRHQSWCCWKPVLDQPGNSETMQQTTGNVTSIMQPQSKPRERNLNGHIGVIMPYRDIR